MSVLFLNGEFIAADAARISVADRGFTLSDGVFDTMLAVDGALQFGDAHFARLRRHADVMQIPLLFSGEALIQVATDLLRQNEFCDGRYAVRTTLTRGTGARGLAPPENPSPTLVMRATPTPDAVQSPRLIIAETTRRNEHSPLSRIKSLGYGDNLLALMEAKARGADDAILLNTAGNVACATTSNVFIREGGQLFTPPCADGALEGIMRQTLLDNGEAREETISPERLRAAEEVMLTNSIAAVRTGVLDQ